jgi:hypothetical protein
LLTIKNKPNQLVFDSKLKKRKSTNHKVWRGELNKLNGNLPRTDQNVFQRPVLVGSANPNYTPLDQISPYLRKSVLTTEDPSSSHIVVLSLKLSNNPLLKH